VTTQVIMRLRSLIRCDHSEIAGLEEFERR